MPGPANLGHTGVTTRREFGDGRVGHRNPHRRSCHTDGTATSARSISFPVSSGAGGLCTGSGWSKCCDPSSRRQPFANSCARVSLANRRRDVLAFASIICMWPSSCRNTLYSMNRRTASADHCTPTRAPNCEGAKRFRKKGVKLTRGGNAQRVISLRFSET